MYARTLRGRRPLDGGLKWPDEGIRSKDPDPLSYARMTKLKIGGQPKAQTPRRLRKNTND